MQNLIEDSNGYMDMIGMLEEGLTLDPNRDRSRVGFGEFLKKQEPITTAKLNTKKKYRMVKVGGIGNDQYEIVDEDGKMVRDNRSYSESKKELDKLNK